jgi:hypothetical protein
MVIDPRTQALLQNIVSRETRTLLLYTGDAFPWTRTEGQEVLGRLQQLIGTERSAINALGRFLARQRIPPPPTGLYPGSFTSWNFVALEALLPRLVQAQEESIAALEKDLHALTNAEARAEVEKLLAAKKNTLESLRVLNPVAAQAPAGA